MISKLNKIKISKAKIWFLIHFFLFSFFISTITLYLVNFYQSNGILIKDFIFIGGDYICFYISSLILNINGAQLYDFSLQKNLRVELFPELNDILQNELYFIYPPLVAQFFNILKCSDYATSYLVYSVLSILILLTSLFFLCSSIGFFKDNSMLTFILLILGYPAYTINCMIGGQLSWVATSIYSICYILITRGMFFYAGLVFSLSYYKPPLFVISALVFSIYLKKTFLLGFILGGTILVCLTCLVFSKELFFEYLIKASSYTYDQDFVAGVRLPPDQGAGLVGLVFSLPVMSYAKISILLFCLLVMLYSFYRFSLFIKKKSKFTNVYWYSAVVCISCLFSIQFIRYDLTILLVPFFLLLSASLSELGISKHMRLNAATLMCIILFYIESNFRFIEYFGVRFNLSSILLFTFSLILILRLRFDSKTKNNLT